MNRLSRRILLGCVALAAFTANGVHSAPAADPVKAAEGFWAYTLLEAGGKARPLSGIILFKDGLFAQQSVYDGEPFDKQGAMAHAGPFGAGPRGVRMTAEQQVSIAPERSPPLSFRSGPQHDISVDRDGDTMTIVFASGTIQKFKRIGPAAGEVHKLDNGLLAFIDGHFVLVAGDAKGVATGYGKFKHNGTAYDLNVIRWAEADGAKSKNLRDVTLEATFDGKTLALADGRKYNVAK